MSFEMCLHENTDETSSLEPCYEMNDWERGKQLTDSEKEQRDTELKKCEIENRRKELIAEELKDKEDDALGLIALENIIERLNNECQDSYEMGIEIDKND